MFKIVLVSKYGDIYSYDSREEVKKEETEYFYSCKVKAIDIDEVIYLTNIVAVLQYTPSKLIGTKNLTIGVLNNNEKIQIKNLTHCTLDTYEDKENRIKLRSEDENLTFNYYYDYFDFIEVEDTEKESKSDTDQTTYECAVISENNNRFNIVDAINIEKLKGKVKKEERYILKIKKNNSICIISNVIGYVINESTKTKYNKGNYILNLDFSGKKIQIKNINRTDVNISINKEGGIYVQCDGYRVQYFYKHLSRAYISSMSSDVSSNIKKIINTKSKSMVLSL